MKLYCYTENGEVVEGPITLPMNWKNISNFYALDDETLRSYGWYPYAKVSDFKDIIVGSSFAIENNIVVETVETRDKTAEEIEAENNQILAEKWLTVRAQRDDLLKKSDIYVLVDRWNNMDSEEQQQWAEYRQLLRDIPQTYIDPDLVIFPTLPS